MPGKRLSLSEREFIQAGRRDGMSCRAMGVELGRPHTTISRELARNTMAHNGAYLSQVAHHRSRERARRPKAFKLSCNPQLARHIAGRLARKWSPQQTRWGFAATIPIIHAGGCQPNNVASLYVQGRGGLKAELVQHLRHQHPTRKHGNGPGQLPDRVHISQRPAEAHDRAVPGHWEGDLLLGTPEHPSRDAGRAHHPVLLVVRVALRPHRRLGSEPRSRPSSAPCPEHLRRSLTWDNGKEMAEQARRSRWPPTWPGLLLRARATPRSTARGEHHRLGPRLPPQRHRPVPLQPTPASPSSPSRSTNAPARASTGKARPGLRSTPHGAMTTRIRTPCSPGGFHRW